MNQIFRVIWSQATQTWVAVSELTKAHKKQSATSTAQESAVKILGQFFKLSTLTFAMLGATQAYAAISAASVANEVPDTTPTDLLKGIVLNKQATENKNNTIPTKLDNGTQLTYIGADGTSQNVNAYSSMPTGKLTTTNGAASVTEATLVDLLNTLRTQYVSINSDSGTNQYNTGAKTYTEAINAIAIGKNAVATDAGSIALGFGAKNERIVETGRTNKANPSELQRATNAVSIGTNALTTYSGAIALGFGAEARGQSSIVIGENAKTFSPWNAKEGKYDQAFRSILIGYNTQAGNTNGIGIGTRAQSWSNDGIVIGRDSIVNHPDSIVIGRESKSKGGLSQGIGTVTIGQGASAGSADNNRSSVAIGKQSYTGASFGIATNTYTKDANGVLDANSKATVDGANMSYNSTAIGSNAGTGYNIVDIVNTATTDTAGKAVAAGTVVKRAITRDANGNPTGVIFYTTMADDGKGNITYATVDASKVSSGYAGNMATSKDTTETVLKKSGFNTATGALSYQETNANTGATTTAKAFLKTTQTTNDQTALGAETRAIGDSSVAIGARSIAGRNAVVIGSTSSIAGNNAWNAEDRRANATAVNTYANATALGSRNDLDLTTNVSSGSALVRYQGLTGRTVAASAWQKTDAPYGVDGSIVLGSASHSSAALGIAQGVNSSVMKGAVGGVAIGAGATVDANSAGAVALGMGSAVNVEALGGLAIGTGATVTGRGTTPIATVATERGTDAIAIGTKATADVANSVALGSGSTTVKNSATREKEGEISKEISPGVTETIHYGTFFGTPGVGSTAGEAAAANPGYMVSVGDASTNTYRQIKNVAAGAVSEKSTDAINGSQLFAVTKFVTDGWKITGNDTATTVENIMPRERVSFVNGKNTTSTVTANKDGGADVTFNVDTTALTVTDGKVNAADTKSLTDAVTAAQTAVTAAQTAVNTAQTNANNAQAAYNANPTDANKTALDNANNALAVAQNNLTAANGNLTTAQEKVTNAGNRLITAADVRTTINESGWNATSAATSNGEVSGTTVELVNPGETVTFEADKNMKITQAGNKFTFATKDNVDFNSVNIGNPNQYTDQDGNPLTLVNGKYYKTSDLDENGQPKTGVNEVPANSVTTNPAPVNMTTKAATPATNNSTNNAPTTALDISSNGKPTQITGVGSTLNTQNIATSPNGTATTGNDQPKLVNLVDSKDNPVNSNAAATVGDLQNMGWVVSSDKVTGDLGKAYKDVVKNANEVKFVGTGLATVSGKTDGDVRTITVDVNAQNVTNSAVNPIVYTDKDGKTVYPTGKTDDQGNQIFNTKPDGTGDTVTGDVKTTVNGPKGTSSPTALTNVKSNLPNVSDENKNATDVDGNVIKDSTNTKAPITAKEAADLVKNAGNNAATVSDVLNAGWNLQNNGEARDFVKPYDTVNFIDGVGTTAVVTTAEDGVSSTVTFNVDKGTVSTTTNGSVTGPVTSNLTDAVTNAQKAYDDAQKASDEAPDNQDLKNAAEAAKKALDTANQAVTNAGNQVATAQNVADAINKSGWRTNSTTATGGAKDTLINPGKAVNFEAGKNIQVTQVVDDNGNVSYTYATKDNVDFNSVNIGNPNQYTDKDGNPLTLVDGKYYKTSDLDENGQPKTGVNEVPENSVTTNPAPVNMTTKAATPATNNVNADGSSNQPTTALDISSNGKPTQITGVGSTLNTQNIATSPDGTATTGDNRPKLVDLVGTNDAPVNSNAAATVGDLQNMGWVVSSDKVTGDLGKAYSDVVKNANEVKFVGEGSAIVSGKTVTDDKGNAIRTITVAVDSQSAVENAQIPVVYTDAAGNKLTKVGDEFYPADSVVIDGKRYPKGSKKVGDKVMNEAGTEEATALNPTDKGDIIASMNNGENNAAPTTLSNVKSNIPTVSDADKNAKNVDGTVIDGSTNTKAPITAEDAANYLAPTIKNEKGENVANPNFRGNNAATVSDVLNAGWNLQNNGEARDFVKPYDTVNFVNGGNTVAVVTTAADGTTSDVTFNVTGLPTTFTTADGSPVSKVGDNYYKVDKNGQPVSEAGKPAVGKNADGKYVDADGTVINPINTASNPLQTNLVNPNVANTDAAPNNQTKTATQLGNVANGANTFDAVDNTGAPLKQAANGNYYPADKVNADGSLVDGTTDSDIKSPIKLANDGKWYPASEIGSNGAPNTGATAVTKPANIGKAGLIDFTNSNPNNAATVGDLQNMGWVVSSDKTTGNLGTAYSDQVRNANEVKFVGTNLATVSGTTDANGVRIITVDVDAQKTVETAQNPVVYTDNQGNKLTKVGDNFYPADSVVNNGNVYPAGSVVIDGNVYPEGTVKNEAGKYVNKAGDEVSPVTDTVKPVDKGNIAASMNSGNNKTEPTKLANVGSNLKQVVDPTIGADGKPVDGTASVNNPDGKKADGDQSTNKAPITAKDAADLLKPTITDSDGKTVNNPNYIGNNAATVSDVLNAGWNLQNNGEARDFVKPYDTVNFVNGGNTVAVVTTAADGTTSDVTFNVTGLPIATTTQDANGNNIQLVKVGDNYYPVNADGTPNIQKDAAGNPTNGYVKANDGNYYPAGDVTYTTDTAGNTTIAPKKDAKPTTFANNLVNPNVANATDAPNNQVNNATQLGNVANGANTIAPVDKDGKALKLANNGKYYPADQVNDDGSLKDEANSTEAQPLKLANDGKWYPANQVNANGSTVENAAPVTTQLNPGKAGLIDFANSNPNNAATVGDLQNMGWVVSSDKTTGNLGTAYNDQVRNANEVKFVGINGAIVSGQTVDGVRTITVSMDTAGITNNPNGSAISDAQKAADDAKKALDEAIAKNTSTPTPDNQKAVENAQKAYDDANKAVTEAGNKLVTANTVTNAINNSGWNLQNNGEQKDLVKPSDIVNFVNGGNTVANVTTKADGTSSDVTFNVVGLPIANTVTDADGKQVPLVKVGDNYYPANEDGTPNITKDAAGNPTNGYVLADDGKYYPAGDVDFGTKDGKATITPKADKAPVTVNTNLVNPNAPKGGDQVNNATQLGNVANGANTFDAPKVDANGNELTKVGDQYYTADQLVNGQPKEGAKGLVQGNDGNIYNADDLNNGVPKDSAKPAAEGMKLANDGKWYKASDVNPNGTTKDGATSVKTPVNPGNAGLIDFANSNPNNAATVGDLQNMGWVVSTSDKDGKETYNNQVRNNNKVDFTGEDLATVTGKTLEDGTRQITVSVKTGEVVPTDRDQNSGKATIKDKDGKDQTIDVVKASDGNWYPADQVTRTTDDNGNTVIKPNQGATAIAQNNVTVPNAGSGLVTGNQVGDAIQQSGWNVGLADKAKADEAFGDSSKALSADKLEKVNPDDNVRFADGKGTKVSAATVEEVNKDGKKVTNTYVKVDIDAGEVKANDNGSVSGPVTQALKDAATAAKTAVDAAQTALNDAQTAYNNAKPEEKDALKAKLDTAQAAFNNANTALTNANNAVTNAGNQVATAQNVADAINNSGFNLKTSGNKVPGTQDNGELIKPSNTVEMIAGKNLTVKQDTNGKVTYETANDVQFNSVQFGGDTGPKITNNGSALNVNGAKIDGVADGDISPNSKEAVNGGQIYALTRGDVPNTTNITTTVTNPDGSTTTKTYENVISDKDGKPILTTYNVYGQTEVITNSTLTAIRNMNEQGIKFFHTNDAEAKPVVEDQNRVDSSASGSYATAIGYQAQANGTNAVAMGKGSQALAENTIAIGSGNIVSATKSGAFGDPNYIDGKEVDGVATVSGSYAFGNDNVINSSNTFVLGNNVNNKGTTTNGRPDAMGTTVENSVYLGNQTTATAGDGSRTGTLRNLDVNGNQGATTTAGSTGTVSQAVVGNLTYGGFAGAKANGVVSVGAAGSERRIQNVAAGEISATSTDAINGSQLYSVARGVSNLAGQVNKMGKRMDANAAAAMAAANLLQAYREGQSAVTAGIGQHRGQAAVAVGYSRLSDSGKIGIKFSLSADTQGEVSTGAGIGYFW